MPTQKRPVSLLNAHFDAQLLRIIVLKNHSNYKHTHPVNNYKHTSLSNMVLEV